MLEPGHLAVESGYCALPDGTGYVASLTAFPGATPEMFSWWFWWHSVEAARYTLWFPWNHVSAIAQDRDVLSVPGLSDAQRYIGNTHFVDEYIGADIQKIAIEFIDPRELGFDAVAFAGSGVSAHACANIYLRRPAIRIGSMVHLIRETDDGLELRSRYWLASRMAIGRPGRVDIDRAMGAIGVKARIAGEALAYEQLLHDQVEFTHLAGILPDLYAEFGPGKNTP